MLSIQWSLTKQARKRAWPPHHLATPEPARTTVDLGELAWQENWPGSAMIIAVRSKDKQGRKSIDEIRYTVTNFRTGVDALLRLVRDRWSIVTGPSAAQILP
jgi:hypothetical protein